MKSLVVALALLPAAALAEAPVRLDLSYAIYASGAHLMTLDSHSVLGGGAYAVDTDIRTEGLANWLTRFTMKGQSAGALRGGEVQPVLYTADTDGRWGRRVSGLHWTGSEVRVVRQDPPVEEEPGRGKVAPELRKGTIDPMAAIVLRALRETTPEACAGTARVFDAVRRYDLNFTPAGAETLRPTRYSAFAGDTIKCEVRVVPIAGYSKALAAETEKNTAEAITLWLAESVDPRLRVPVRLEVANTWGAIMIHLTRAAVDGETRLRLAD